MVTDSEVKILIRRTYEDKQTLSDCLVFNERNGIALRYKGLELPWKDNKRRVSCIPEGVYEAIIHDSPKFGRCVWIQNVPDRSEILIHAANYVRQLLGCQAAGKSHIDIDGDGLKDVTSSRKTVNEIVALLPNKFKVQIEKG